MKWQVKMKYSYRGRDFDLFTAIDDLWEIPNLITALPPGSKLSTITVVRPAMTTTSLLPFRTHACL